MRNTNNSYVIITIYNYLHVFEWIISLKLFFLFIVLVYCICNSYTFIDSVCFLCPQIVLCFLNFIFCHVYLLFSHYAAMCMFVLKLKFKDLIFKSMFLCYSFCFVFFVLMFLIKL